MTGAKDAYVSLIPAVVAGVEAGQGLRLSAAHGAAVQLGQWAGWRFMIVSYIPFLNRLPCRFFFLFIVGVVLH